MRSEIHISFLTSKGAPQPELVTQAGSKKQSLLHLGTDMSKAAADDEDLVLGYLTTTVLCAVFAPNAVGPGAPEIKAYLNGVDTPNMYGSNTLFVKIIGSIAAVCAGLDLGKEGPLIHIGTCIASLTGQGGPDNYKL